jgi:L-ribulose-5-phosphate 3-epimerase
MELKIGIRAHDLVEKKTPEELANALHEHGFSYAQLVMNKAFSPYSYEENFVKEVSTSLKEKGITVAMLGAYFNPVHSNPQVVQDDIANFKANLRIAHEFGHPFVGSETGSFNDSPWTYNPKNQTEEGYQASKAVFAELARYAEEVGEDITIEGAWGHVMYCPKVLKRLVDELHSPRVHVTVDLYNYLYEGNFAQRDQIFLEALQLFGSEVKIIHLKDAKLVEGKLVQVAPGQGDFHYSLMIEAIRKYCSNAVLVFEGVKARDIDASHRYLETLLD